MSAIVHDSHAAKPDGAWKIDVDASNSAAPTKNTEECHCARYSDRES